MIPFYLRWKHCSFDFCLESCNGNSDTACIDRNHMKTRHPRPLMLKPDGRLEVSTCTPCGYWLFVRLHGGLCSGVQPYRRPNNILPFDIDGEGNDDGRYLVVPDNQTVHGSGESDHIPTYWVADSGEDDAYQGKIAVVLIGHYSSVELCQEVIRTYSTIIEEWRDAMATENIDMYGDYGDCELGADENDPVGHELPPHVSHHQSRCVGSQNDSMGYPVTVSFGSYQTEGSTADFNKIKFTIYVDDEARREWMGEGTGTVYVPACSEACIVGVVAGSLDGWIRCVTYQAIETSIAHDPERLRAAEEMLETVPTTTCDLQGANSIQSMIQEMGG